MIAPEIRLIALHGIPEIKPNDDLPHLIALAAKRSGIRFQHKDVLIVTQKVVSKAEGRVVKLDSVEPSASATSFARILKKDARVIELILRETKRIVKMARGIIIVETRHGFVCANAGVDQSNVKKGSVSLLPINPDESAENLRDQIRKETGAEIGVVISDTFGRQRSGRSARARRSPAPTGRCGGTRVHHRYRWPEGRSLRCQPGSLRAGGGPAQPA